MGFTNLFKISRNRDVSDSTPPRDNRSFSASNPPTPSKKSTNPPLIQSLVVLATKISPPPQNKASLQRGPRLPGSDPREAGPPSRGSARNEDRNEGGMFGPRKGRRGDEDDRKFGGALQDRSPRRRRTGSLSELEGGLDRLSFAPPRTERLDGRFEPSREPLQTSRPSDYSRMDSNQGITRPASLVFSGQYYSHQRSSYQPPQSPTRPPIVSKYSTSMYPQAYPTPPRPLPPPRSRGPDPFSTPHKSAKNTPILPGAFPNSAKNTPTPPPPSHPSISKNRSTPPPPPLLPKRHSYQPISASISRATPPSLQTPSRPRPTSSLDTRRYSSQIYGPQYSAPTSSSQINGVSFRNPHPSSLPFPPSTTTPTKSDSALSSTYRTTPTRPTLPASTHSLPTQLPARRLIPLTPSLSTNSLVSISSSPSSSPSRSAIKNQCQGTTASSKRCTRIVNEGSKNNSPSPSPKKVGVGAGVGMGSGSEKKVKKKEREMVVLCGSDLDELDEILGRVGQEEEGEGPSVDGKEVARFCFQHSKQAMQERGCFVNGKGGKGEWIEFDDWISADLPTATKILLRYEMTRPVSDKDEEGYIYVHEMVEHKKSQASNLPTSATIFLKLGRSITPVARLAQWRHQCPSRSPIVRDIFPGALSNCEQSGAGIGGALRVRERGGKYHHRWERLVLIEVSGRAGKEAEGRGTEGESAGTGTGRVRSVCVDCGKVHFELFEVGAGAYEIWVKGVVEKWMRWCGEILG